MKTRILLTILLTSLIYSGCEKSEWLADGDYFFLKHKDAVMPVWVNGNIASGIFEDRVGGVVTLGDADLFFAAVGKQVLLENRTIPDGELRFWDISEKAGVDLDAVGFSVVAADVLCIAPTPTGPLGAGMFT